MLEVELEEPGVEWIRLNRPERLNAINDELMIELNDALAAAGNDPAVRCVVITGNGRAFCAGGDVSNMGTRTAEQTLERVMRLAASLISTLAQLARPVIGAVNGPALGGGLALAMACDIILMHEQAFLAQSYTDRGLVPDLGFTFFLPRLIGLQRAKELTLTGRRIDAAEAVAIGLAARQIEADRFEAEVRKAAIELAQRPTLALGAAKRLLNRSFEAGLPAMAEAEALAQAVSITSADHKAAVEAFMSQRRKST
jgi:2-(1,2-epoxy-1,2-dihydrophenyl)acetyl-CoA isomerase